MKKFDITGMSCAACVARVEKAVSKVKGVKSCSVSLLTNSMGVEGNFSENQIIHAVEAAGYGASLQGSSQAATKIENSEQTQILSRILQSLIFLAPLLYLSMGASMWNFPLPDVLVANKLSSSLIQLILATIIIVINKKFFVSGIKSILHFAPNMDSLVALGSGVSYIYSLVQIFYMSSRMFEGDVSSVNSIYGNLYFESSAMILVLISVGKLLEQISKGKTTNALKSLMDLAPQTAVVLVDGQEVEMNCSQVKVSDIFIVRPGQKFPVDGIVLEGQSSVNESAISGESLPVEKEQGSEVISGTLNQNGFLKCRATKVGTDTTISKIIQMVKDNAATKAPSQKIADKVSGFFVPAVILISIVTFVVWKLLGAENVFALNKSICVLVISCPCALGLATPVAIMVGNGMGAKNGILFKTSSSLENCGKVKVFAFDKTGTLTKGQMVLKTIVPMATLSKDEILKIAASLESRSEHPLAKSICSAVEPCTELFEVTDWQALPGNGLTGKINQVEYFVGNKDFIVVNQITINDEILNQIKSISANGETPVILANKNSVLALFGISDELKEDSAEAVNQLKKLGLKTVMITGDNELTAKAIGKICGIDQIIASVKPDQKSVEVDKLKKFGKVCMVGDGINDGPALTKADIGIAIGAGSDVAVDAADIVLVKNSLIDVVNAVRLSRRTLLNIKENLFWAFIYNILGIPLAAGCYYKIFGWSLSPMFGALAMSLSSFCVVTNALRLNLYNFKNSKINRNKIQKEKSMEKIIKVDGMMCGHCESHVKTALEKIPGVKTATPDHNKKEVVLELESEVDMQLISKAVEEAGYTFLG